MDTKLVGWAHSQVLVADLVGYPHFVMVVMELVGLGQREVVTRVSQRSAGDSDAPPRPRRQDVRPVSQDVFGTLMLKLILCSSREQSSFIN